MRSNAAPEPSPAAVETWLQSLLGLLAPLGPTALVLRASERERTSIEWIEVLSDPQEDVRAQVPADFRPNDGWLIPLGSRDGVFFSLLLCTEVPLMGNAAGLVLVGAVCKSGFGLLWPRHDWLPRDGTSECLHDLRNGLNTVMMSAAILGGPKLPAELRVFATDLENGAQRSVRALSELSVLLRQ